MRAARWHRGGWWQGCVAALLLCLVTPLPAQTEDQPPPVEEPAPAENSAVPLGPAPPREVLGPTEPAVEPRAADRPLGPAPAAPAGPEEPTATPSLVRADLPTPPSGPPEETPLRDDQVFLKADYLKRDGPARTLFAEGNLFVRWRDLAVSGERALFDFQADTLHVDGPIRLTREDGTTFDTTTLDLDLATEEYRTDAFQAVLPPEVIGRGATEPFYLFGDDAFSLRDNYFVAHRVTFSSCPPNDLKYKLTAKTIAVIPDRSVTLRSAKVYLFGLPVFAWGKLVLPLRRYRRPEWLPEIGRNEIYGFYTRMRYFYDLAYSQLGDVSAMVTEKRGVFLGLEHDYGIGRGNYRGEGRLDFEYGTEQSEISFRGDLNQSLGADTQLRVNGSYSQNSGFSSTSSQSNVTSQLVRRFDLGSTTFGFSRSSTESGASFSSFTRWNVDQRIDLGPIFQAELDADYARRQAPSIDTDDELETRARFRGQWTLFDWEVIDERRFDIEGARYAADDDRATTEIVPQLTLSTDSRRFNLPYPEWWDVRLDTSFGAFREFVQLPGDSERRKRSILRANFDFNGNLNRFQLGEKLRFLSQFRYNQSFFDEPNPAAKYILAIAPTMEWRPLDNTRLDFRYRWQEVSGFSPLNRFDFAQTINDLDYSAYFYLPDPIRPRGGLFSVTLNGGFDLLRGTPRDLRIGVEAQPIDPLYLTFNTSYGLAGRGIGDVGFRSLRGQLVYDGGRRYRHEVGFTYDARNGLLQNVDSLLEIEPLPRVTVQNALTWDGVNNRISFNDILVNYDMGCVQLLGTYRQEVQEFRLDLNITAFPGFASLFGTGRFGEQFSTSQGFSF